MKKGRLLTLLGLLCVTAALGLTAYNIIDDIRAGENAATTLEKLMPLIGSTEEAPSEAETGTAEPAEPSSLPEETDPAEPAVVYPEYILHPDMPMPVKIVDGNAYIGVVSVPSAGTELPVYDSWDYVKLKQSACRFTGSVYLDNMVIAAHNNSRHFGPVRNVKLGDAVYFTDMDGNVFTYSVVEVETLYPTEVERMTTGDWDLTLFTCTTGGKTRVTVRCERTGAASPQ